MIGGPDLAMSTLAPHRFLDFLAGKLGARFVGDRATPGAASADAGRAGRRPGGQLDRRADGRRPRLACWR